VISWTLPFTDRFNYSGFNDIRFPLTLSSAVDKQILIRAQLDTGSTLCVFQRAYADLLGLEMEQGTQQKIRTATGSFTAYGHEVTIAVALLEWQAVVYFATNEDFDINVVGRQGFLDRLRVGLVDYEQLLYLGAYEET
jgi:hypothetical protein